MKNHKSQAPNNKQNQNSKLLIFKYLIFVFVCYLALSAWSLASAMSGVSGASGAAAPAGRQLFVGVFREGAPRNMNFITQFEAQTGKKPAMVMWYQDWAQVFPAADVEKVSAYGAVPHIVWEPWYWGESDKVKLKDIINGKWDDYILSWARAIAQYKKPIFLRVGHEFNISDYPWGIVHNDKDPQVYIRAYRRVVDIFRKEKAGNVRWVWSPMSYSYPDEVWNDWTAAYPGDAYVDWIGFDAYNWGTTQSWSVWQEFKNIFRDSVRLARRRWPDKPIMVAEFAAAEKGGDKAAWIRDIPKYLRTSIRDIDLIIWFDHKKETDWRINSSPKALAAFKEIMKDPLFAGSGADLLSFSLPAARDTKRRAAAPRAPGSVKIDGDLGDWNLVSPIVMKDAAFFKEGLDWSGPADLSGSAYVMWDDSFIYFAAQINDVIPLVNTKKGSEIWNGDAIEIVMTTDPGADPKRTSFARKDYQIGLGTGDGKANKPTIWNWQRRRSPTGSEISVKKRREGYILEAKIPWEFFGAAFRPTPGTTIGFDIAFDDADKTGEREKQFIWNGDFDFYQDPSVWGILEFTK